MPSLGPDVVRRQVVIGACALSPDGESAVYTRRVVAGNAYQTDLWLVPARGGRPRRLTTGGGNDHSPVFAPDGRTIAFVSDRGNDDERGALHRIRVDGGEAELVCEAPHGSVRKPAYSPDGRSIAFVAWAGEPRFWVGDADDRVVRVIRTVDWRDDTGDADYRSHVHVVAARPGARPRQVTHGELDAAGPAWHPDGRRIAFAAGTAADQDVHPRASIHEVEVESGDRRELVALRGTAHSPAWSPGGGLLAFVGTNVPGAPDHAEPEMYVWDGERRPRSLTRRLDLPVTLGWCSDLHDWIHAEIPPPQWDGDEALVVPINRRGRDEVWRIPVHGEPQPLTEGDTTLGAVAVGGGRVVATAADDAYPPELCAVEGGNLRRLTRHGSAWLRRHDAAARARGGRGRHPHLHRGARPKPAALGARAVAARRPVRCPRPHAGAGLVAARGAGLPRAAAQHPRLRRVRRRLDQADCRRLGRP